MPPHLQILHRPLHLHLPQPPDMTDDDDVPNIRIVAGTTWVRIPYQRGMTIPGDAVIGVNKDTGRRYVWVRADDTKPDGQ